MRKPKPEPISQEILDDPVAFIEAFCINSKGEPAVLFDSQKEVLAGLGFYTILACGRQWGKSSLIGWYVTWFICTHPNRLAMCVAPALDQSKIIFSVVARQFRQGPLKHLLKGKVKNSPFPELELTNGSRLIGRGANSPQYIRGNSPHLVVIDEAAFVKNGTIKELEPLMTVTGKEADSGIICTSTPFGLGEFYELYDNASTEPGAYRRRHHFTSFDTPLADLTFLEEMRLYHGEDSPIWRTEYLAQFIGDEMAVFSQADIEFARDAWPYLDEATGNPIYPMEYINGHTYCSGVDLANTSDFFVQTLLDITDPTQCVLSNFYRLQNYGYDFYKEQVRKHWRDYNRPETLIDATTLAEVFVEDLKDIGAKGYKFTGTQAKYDAVQSLVKMFSERRLAIPPEPELMRELHYFTYSITKSKKIKMEAKRGHDDIVMALALAAILVATPHALGTFMAVDAKAFRDTPVHTVTAGKDPYWGDCFD